MIFYNLDSLKRDPLQDNLYDLFLPTFKYLKNQIVPTYNVGVEQSMRPDIVSQETYGTSDYVDFLLDVNDIDNPLNIMNGDVLRTPSLESLQSYRLNNQNFQINKKDILDKNKKTNIDPNRRSSINPTVNQNPSDPVIIKGNNVTIGGT